MACINWTYYKANPTYKARIETLEGMFGSFHAELFIHAYNEAYPDKKEPKYDFYIPSYKEAISFLTSTKQQVASRFIEALDDNNNLSINDVPLLLQGVVAPVQGRLTVISGRIKSRQAGVNPILSLNLNVLENINHKYPETFTVIEEDGVHYVQYTSPSNVRHKYLNHLIKENLPTQSTPQQEPRAEASGFIEKTIIVKKDDKSNWTLIVKPDGSVINANNNKEVTDERLINKARLKAKFYNYRVVENVNGIKYAITDDNRVFTLAETTMGKEISKNSSTYTNIIVKGYASNFYNKYKNIIKSIEQAENYIRAALKTDRENTLNKLKDCF